MSHSKRTTFFASYERQDRELGCFKPKTERLRSAFRLSFKQFYRLTASAGTLPMTVMLFWYVPTVVRLELKMLIGPLSVQRLRQGSVRKTKDFVTVILGDSVLHLYQSRVMHVKIEEALSRPFPSLAVLCSVMHHVNFAVNR